TPYQAYSDDTCELSRVPLTDGSATQSFRSVRESIQPVGCETEEVQQNGIGGQHGITLLGSEMGEPGHASKQAGGAYENVGIYLEQPAHGVALQHRRPSHLSYPFAVTAPDEHCAGGCAAKVGKCRGSPDTGDTPVQAVHKNHHCRQIRHIDEDLNG